MFGRARRASLLAAIFFATETSRPFLVPKDTRRGVLATGVVTVVAEHVASASAEDKNSAEKAVEAAASQLSLGQRGDELVLPAWFGGEWACFGELYKVESSSRTKEFNAALPGALEFVKKNQEAVGTEAGNFRARRRWQPSGRPAPGGGKGVLEDRAGLAAGAVAAAYTLGGPTPRLKPQGDDFLVADRWRLTPAGAVARADPEEEELKALRVSELFEVRQKDQEKLAAAVRVVTLWKQAPLPEEAKKTLDTSRKLMQAIQTVYLLPDPSAAATKEYEASVKDKCYFDISIGNRYAGRIVFGLYSDVVPLTCENFLQLCKGYRIKDRVIGYQNTIFHLIKPGSAIAGGDVLDGAGKTRGLSIYGEQFPDENFEFEFVRDGDLAMCNWGKNTNSSVFMITLSQQRAFTNHHVVFGTVLKGMKVVREIGELGTKVGRPAVPIRIVQCGVLDGDTEPPPPLGDLVDESVPLMTEDEFRSLSANQKPGAVQPS